jgi:glycerol-1-phosphate dehydrogenase [NAD(P)+]
MGERRVPVLIPKLISRIVKPLITTPVSLTEALGAAQETRFLEIGEDVLARTPSVFQTCFGSQPAVLIADANTYKAAGAVVSEAFRQAGQKLLAPFIFEDSDLYAEHRFVERLEASLREHQAVPVAIGSGTINDLTKLSSHRTGRKYMCVGTAASMDGYTAFGASITYRGAKQTFVCPAPAAVVADLNVICRAPGKMNSWGYTDLLAKVPAGADWLLADALGIEPLHQQAWDIVQGRLREMTSDPAGVPGRDKKAIGRLTEGLMLGGFAMQACRSSRAASGAEHQFSHLWDMQHHTHNGIAPSHGFKVGIGTLAITALYEQLLAYPMSELDVARCVAKWPSLETWIARAAEWLKDPDMVAGATKELEAKYTTPEDLREQLGLLKAVWPELRERVAKQLLPLNVLKSMLVRAGSPVEPEDIGITRERLRQTYWSAYCIRRRFTVLDLAARIGILDNCLDHIFGPQGLWPVSNGKSL